MKKKIELLAGWVVEDIQKTRINDEEAKERIGAEVMALNALCNAENVLNGKCQCKDND